MSEKRYQVHAYQDGGGSPGRRFDEIATRVSETFELDLEWVLSRLNAVNINDVYVVDLTKPEFDLPVARVVIPGLEGPHDDDLYIPGPRASAVAGKSV
jgi:ribosomal protein S12 methylthiotransferase accessory factor